MNKWQALRTKFADRYAKLYVVKGCNFTESYNEDSAGWDSVSTCKVRVICNLYDPSEIISMIPVVQPISLGNKTRRRSIHKLGSGIHI